MAKEYTLIGGNGTVVSPLEVTEDGDYVAGDSRAFNPVKVRTGSGGSSTLSGLTDVDISNPSDGQTLVYNASAGKWENGSGGGSFSGVRVFEAIYGNDNSLTLSVTAETLFEAMQSSVCVVKTTNGIMSLVLWKAFVWNELYTFDAFNYSALSLAATDMVFFEWVSD